MDSDNSDNEDRRNNYAESKAEDEDEDGVIRSDEENNENQENEPQPEQNEENKEEDVEKQIVKPKRVIRNPQPKLNAETLKGPRGLKALNGYFKDIKYKGKGHESEDLQVILKTYEHWCHRLFPKLPFDDCVKKLETLGAKKPVVTFIKKIRLGMEEDEANKEDVTQNDQETDDRFKDLFSGHTEDIFDRLVQERPAPAQTITRIEEEDTPLTEEQLERITINRKLALERRRLRMQQAANDEQITSNTELNTENEENIREIRRSDENSMESNENVIVNSVLGEDEGNLQENISESQENRQGLQENLDSNLDSSTNEDYFMDNMAENDSGVLNRENEIAINPPLVVVPSHKSIPENNIFKGPQEKLIIINSVRDDITNEAVLVEISQDSDPSEAIIEELSQSSTNGGKEKVLLQKSGPLSTSNVDEMDVDYL